MNSPAAAAAALAALALLVPATAAAKPAVCQRATLEAELVDGGQLTVERIANGQRVNLVRCGDVTDDGDADALFAVVSGGTAGNTRFGVIEGRADGSPGALLLFKRGYRSDSRGAIGARLRYSSRTTPRRIRTAAQARSA